jgi:beta-glucanase (GH16 family)
MQRTLITIAAAAAVAVGVAVPYLTGAGASSIYTLNAEQTAVVVLSGTQNLAPVSTTEAAGLVQETDSTQGQQILQKLGAAALWSYDPSSASFESLARAIPAVGTAIYVRPETIQTIETILDSAVAVAASDETSDLPSLPTPYLHSLYRRGYGKIASTYSSGRGWSSGQGWNSTGAGDLVNNPETATTSQDVTSTTQDVTTADPNETPVGTTTTTTTVPTTTTTIPTTTTTTTTDPTTTTSTTAPSTTTEPSTTTSTSTSTSTTLAPKPTTTTTSTTVLPKKASTTTTSTSTTSTTSTTVAATTTTTGATTSTNAALSPPPGYTSSDLIFNDSASGTSINSSLWNTFITAAGSGNVPWNSNGAGGSGLAGSYPIYDAEYDLPGQVTEGNGLIDIRATETPTAGILDGSPYTFPFASGVVCTYGKFEFTGGYVQIEAKMPAGDGMWPGLWMLPGSGANGISDGNTYEIDIFEGGAVSNVGGPSSNVYAWHLHTPEGVYGADTDTNVNLTTSYNTYGLNWVPGQSITWYLNGNVVGTLTSAQATIPTVPMELIMNLQVANSNTSSWHTVYDSSTPATSDMLVSGVQVYS